MNKKYDVLGIEHPLIDVIANVDYDFLKKFKLKKGLCHLSDDSKLMKSILYELKANKIKLEISSGSSSANTLSAITNIGGTSIFYGSIGDDEFGKKFLQDLKKNNIIPRLFTCEFSTGSTTCLVTPDFERTIVVNLSAAIHFNKININQEDILNSKIIHFTGYTLDNNNMREVSEYIVDIAKKNNIKVSLDISDVGVIERNYDFLKDFLKNVDILFANEEEAKAFTKQTDPVLALKELSKFCEIAIVKIGSKGSYISNKGEIIKIKGVKVNAVDTIGAGDVYAGAILYGLCKNMSLEKAGNLASFLASEIVKIRGGRFNKKINIQEYR